MLKIYMKLNVEAKCCNKRESTGLKHFDDCKAFIEYSNNIDDLDKNIEEYNPNKKHEILIDSDDMIANMHSNIKLNPIVRDSFIRGRKLNISLVFYLAILLCFAKFYALFYHENSKQSRASTNRV